MATTNKVKGWTGVLMTEDSSSHWPIKRRYVYSETSRRAGLEFVCIFRYDGCRLPLVEERLRIRRPTKNGLDAPAVLCIDLSRRSSALLHGPEQIADLPVPVAGSPGAVRIGHPERSHLVEYLAPNSVFNSLPRQRSSPHLRPDDRLVTIDRVLHHASLGVA